MIAVQFVLLSSLLPLTNTASACGWWGDGEMSRPADDFTASDGRPVEKTLGLQSMKLPGKMGYGVAVPKPGQVIPYLLATSGQPLNRIGDLKIFGFRSVVDLATPPPTALLHQAETEAVGMQYFNIPVKGDMFDQEQSDMFYGIVIEARNGPLLVYAPRAALIALMWASYRLTIGAPLEFTLAEGKTMGLTAEQETWLRAREQSLYR